MTNNKQRGDGEILIIISVFILGIIIWLITQQFIYASIVDRWQGDCRSQNGLVVQVSDNRLECFIDGKKTVLKGYEQYQ